MERASTAFVDWYTPRFKAEQSVAIYCGTGNNGGDGLAIARLLRTLGYTVSVMIVGDPSKGSEDFKTNYQRWHAIGQSTMIVSAAQVSDSPADVIIDAIFGSGLTRPVTGWYAELIAALNEAGAIRIAVDIASGLFADHPASGTTFRPDFTVAFQFPKLAFLLPENDAAVGTWVVVDIGLSGDFIEQTDTNKHFMDAAFAKTLVRSRKKFAHKGDFGKVLLVVGSKGKMGAGVLAARACLRAGAGLLTVHVPGVGLDVLQTAVPEAMVLTDPCADHLTCCPPEIAGYDVVAIGPGLGQHPETLLMLEQLLAKVNSPMVIDADALNMVATKADLAKMIPPGSILTPHPREFQRLVGPYVNDFERLEKQQHLAGKYNLNVLVKGAHSTIADPQGVLYFNSTGNPGMATAGSGDVLTGVVTGLLAQGYKGLAALQLGVFLHGAAGDVAADRVGQVPLIASDIIASAAEAWRQLSE